MQLVDGESVSICHALMEVFTMANKEHLDILDQGVEVWNQWREDNPDLKPDLSHGILNHMNLNKADLRFTNLVEAKLVDTNLVCAELTRANFMSANLAGANLKEANLSNSILINTSFEITFCENTQFKYSRCYLTKFCDVDLSTAKGLETVDHVGPSTIGIDTILKSRGHPLKAGSREKTPPPKKNSHFS